MKKQEAEANFFFFALSQGNTTKKCGRREKFGGNISWRIRRKKKKPRRKDWKKFSRITTNPITDNVKQ